MNNDVKNFTEFGNQKSATQKKSASNEEWTSHSHQLGNRSINPINDDYICGYQLFESSLAEDGSQERQFDVEKLSDNNVFNFGALHKTLGEKTDCEASILDNNNKQSKEDSRDRFSTSNKDIINFNREGESSSPLPESLTKSIKSDMNDLLYPNSFLKTELTVSFGETSVAAVVSPPVTNNTIKIFIVKFKRASGDYILHSRVTTPIAVGDLVVVSAERGCEDLGIVTRILSMHDFMAERLLPAVSVEGKPFNINKHTSKLVRLATVNERRKLGMKATDEMDVKLYCQHVAINTFRLPIAITDVDFQFDRRKVTVYYSTAQAQQRVDFRDLVTHLSDVYKTRVWMVLD